FAKDGSNEQLTKEDAIYLADQLNKLKNELKPATETEPHKEVDLGRGFKYFADLQEKPVPVTRGLNNQQTNEIVSSQGIKNAFGYAIMKMDFHTRWTYDFDKVISGYSWVTTSNGLGYTLKGTNVYGPSRNNGDRDWDFTGVAVFAIIVGGMDVSTWTLTTLHDVKYNGQYAWKFVK
ncbi:hypothetical protein ABNF65_24130, partial [Paenibacillus larvae]